MNLPTYLTGNVQTRAYRLLREHVYGVLTEYGVTPTSWAMLGVILQARNGVRQVEIAETLHIKAPLVTTMARQLQERDIIHSAQNQFDARAKLLAITPAGRRFMKTVEAALNKELKQLLAGLTENDLETYHKVLTTIITNDQNLRKQR